MVVRWPICLSYISGMSANALACTLADGFKGLEWLLYPLEEQKNTQMIDLFTNVVTILKSMVLKKTQCDSQQTNVKMLWEKIIVFLIITET